MILEIEDRKLSFTDEDLWTLDQLRKADFPFVGGLECRQIPVGEKYVVVTAKEFRKVKP